MSAGGDKQCTFDRAAALHNCGGDTGLLAQLAAIFLETGPQDLARLRRALEAGDAKELERAAHALKNGLGTLAALAAYSAAQALEEMGRTGRCAEGQAMLPRLEGEMTSLLGDLEALAAGTPA